MSEIATRKERLEPPKAQMSWRSCRKSLFLRTILIQILTIFFWWLQPTPEKSWSSSDWDHPNSWGSHKIHIPSGKLSRFTMENHHFSWGIPLFRLGHGFNSFLYVITRPGKFHGSSHHQCWMDVTGTSRRLVLSRLPFLGRLLEPKSFPKNWTKNGHIWVN